MRRKAYVCHYVEIEIRDTCTPIIYMCEHDL